jgi:hypothetical protein
LAAAGAALVFFSAEIRKDPAAPLAPWWWQKKEYD